MDKYQETFSTWNKVADLYQEKFMNLDIYNSTYDYFCDQIIEQNPKILEVGTGPGNITQYLLQKRPDFHIAGIDVSENMVALAQENNPKANFKVMDARDIDTLNSVFDGIVCGFCLPYLSSSDCKKFIEDCHHLLLDDGLLYISFVEGEEDKSGYQSNSKGDRIYFYYHLLESIADSLRILYFKVLRVFHINYPKGDGTNEIHTIIVARK
jgi:ubiquinone/menaquinone biosynthesis C-methylase UbiE